MVDRYQEMLELAPAPLCEVDLTAVLAGLESHEELRAYLEANPQALDRLMEQLILRNANQAAVELLGAPSKEALLASTSAPLVAESRPLVLELVAALARGERRFTGEGTVATLDGQRLTVQLTLTVLPPAKPGEHRAMMSLVVRPDAIEPLCAVLQALPHPLWVSTGSGAIGGCTRALLELVGLASSEVMGGDWLALVHPDDRAQVAERRRAARAAGSTYLVECRLRAGGGYQHMSICDAPFRNERGDIAGWAGVVTDISDLVRGRQELGQALERSNRELAQIAYAASHDLQEPLRMVASYAQLMQQRYEHRLDERADKYLGYMIEGAKRIRRLILDLLALANVSMEGRELKPASASRIVDMVLMGLETELASCEATITRGDELPMIMADARQMTHVFGNLFSNSLKFRGADSPRIHVSAERDGAMWRFAVADNGAGFDARAYGERVFQMFQRLHPRDQYPGTGIGLTLVRKIVERHGGRTWVESAPGAGTTFYLTLPGVP